MVIPTVLLKIVGGAVACGALASSIAVPTVMSVNVPTGLALEGFPEKYKKRFNDQCQLLIRDETGGKNSKKYLFACKGEDGYEPEFYFYSGGEDPSTFTGPQRQGRNESGQLQITIVLDNSELQVHFTVPAVTWEKFIDSGKKLGECGIIDKGNEEKQWTLKCPKGGSDSVEIPLTPIIIY